MAEEDNKLYPKSRLAEEIALADYASTLPLPVDFGTHQPYSMAGGQEVASRLFGTQGQERFQLWPERMVRSAVSAPYEALSGSFGPPGSRETTERMLEPAMDIAGLAVTGPLAMKPGTASVGSGMTRMAKTGEAAVEHAPAFYSAVENAVKGAKQEKATAEQWLGFLKNQPGVKPEELAWTIKDLPAGQVTKKQLEDHIVANKVELKEVVKSDFKPEELRFGEYSKDLDKHAQAKFGKTYDELLDSQQQQIRLEAFSNQGINPTKYSKYQLPGGENYRELLLTLPDKTNHTIEMLNDSFFGKIKDRLKTTQDVQDARKFNSNFRETFKNSSDQEILDAASNTTYKKPDVYKSSHWDEPNVLAHIRMNDRMVNGKKTLHIEEIQSDWHQVGRKQGYKEEFNQLQAKKDRTPAEEKRMNDIVSEGSTGGVPDAPFKKTWDELALKKVIRHAAENGYDAISWTPGEAQAARYDLSKQVEAVRAIKRPSDGNYTLAYIPKGQKNIGENSFVSMTEGTVPEAKLADFVGKELAEKIVKQNGGKFEGLDLKIGGEGMKAFYDKMLVDKANALGKKFGSKVEQANISKPEMKLSYEELQRRRNGEKPDPSKFQQSIHVMQITPEMKQQVLGKGFPLFSAGLPTLSPIDYDPFNQSHKMKGFIENQRNEMEKPAAPGGKSPSTGTRDVKLVPIDWNPFLNPNAI